jgi:exodeoxyribonuclease V alpha subunit
MDDNEIKGTVAKVVFCNPENGYTVVKIEEPDGAIATATGTLPEVAEGVDLILRGRWTRHPRFGTQFQIEGHEIVVPQTEEGIAAYLGSGLIKNVGPVLARLIVRHFGPDTLRVLDEEPERLTEVGGIGEGRATAIAESWRVHRCLGQLMMSLHEYGISTGLAVRVHQAFGPDALAVLRQNPYRLTEIRGIGFKRADHVARKMGMKADAPERIEAGLLHVLREQSRAGHVYVPRCSLEQEATETLGRVVAPHLAGTLERLARDRSVQVEGDRVYLASLWQAETEVAERVACLLSTPTSTGDVRTVTVDAEGVELSPEQRDAVALALRNKVTVLTDGPGTGKTVTMQALVRALEELRCHYELCSPTGRAARRLAETTGRYAQTVHRLLGYNPEEGFHYDGANPLPVDFVVVDEASMLDVHLTAHLLAALPPSAHVLFVGDVNQLPSVGAGNVLADLIGCGRVAVARLTTVFRQAAGSGIVVNAHRVNEGQFPICNDGFGDFFFFTKEDPRQAADVLVDVVANRIPRTFGLGQGEIQVLAPMYRGECGIDDLNVRLQEALNPAAPRKVERKLGQRLFREGDRVMQTRNNYEKDVFNGDVGTLVRIDPHARRMSVQLNGARVEYGFQEAADELVHAYAVSVHKSQGSEYPAVVVPVSTQHYVMLRRNLLYTAITRARQLVVLVGTHKAVGIAVGNAKVRERHSGLCERLAGVVR